MSVIQFPVVVRVDGRTRDDQFSVRRASGRAGIQFGYYI